jgi:hypothetical protein
VLTLLAERQECLWDEALPIEVKELPEDQAALDRARARPFRLLSQAHTRRSRPALNRWG